jgi:hypothetical protein
MAWHPTAAGKMEREPLAYGARMGPRLRRHISLLACHRCLAAAVILPVFLAGADLSFGKAVATIPPAVRVPRTPWERYQMRFSDRRPSLDRCAALANKNGEFGDVRAHFHWRAKGRVIVEATKSLGAGVRRCVSEALGPFARELHDEFGRDDDFEEWWEIGKARSLFPADQRFLGLWSKTIAGDPAARQAAARVLKRMLPPDVRLADGCLVLTPPARFGLGAGVQAWVKANTKPVDSFWTDEKLRALAGEPPARLLLLRWSPVPHLVAHLERHDLGPEEAFTNGASAPGERVPSVNKLCLHAFDDRLLGIVRKAMDDAGRCWRAGPIESLAEPRFSFPEDRTYVSLRTGNRGQACALDNRGEVTCCGPTRVSLPGRYRDLDVAGKQVCAVSEAGDAACTDLDRGWRELAPPGKLVRVSAGLASACGLSADGRLACASGPAGSARVPPDGRYRQVDAVVSCAIDRAGELSCWSSGKAERVGKGPWLQVASGHDDPGAACALDREGAPWCWSTAAPASSLRREPTSLRFSKVAVGLDDRCGIAADCRLRCWKGRSALESGAEDCVRDVSLGRPSCAVLATGRVRCGGHDMWKEDSSKGGD